MVGGLTGHRAHLRFDFGHGQRPWWVRCRRSASRTLGFGWRWMRKPRKSNPSSMGTILVLDSDRRKPIGGNTAATSSRRPSAWDRVPDTKTTNGSISLTVFLAVDQ